MPKPRFSIGEKSFELFDLASGNVLLAEDAEKAPVCVGYVMTTGGDPAVLKICELKGRKLRRLRLHEPKIVGNVDMPADSDAMACLTAWCVGVTVYREMNGEIEGEPPEPKRKRRGGRSTGKSIRF